VDESDKGRQRLVCYVLADRAVVDKEILREYAGISLPSYMIPATFIILDHLPHTTTGKVNRKALPKPTFAADHAHYTPPSTDTETDLCHIWQTILGVAQVGIHDNFFELGGDSILTIRVVTKAREANLHLQTSDLLKYQTIAELAQVATRKQTTTIPQGIVAETAPLTPIQRWFFAQDFVKPNHWNMGVLLDLAKPLQKSLLRQTLDLLVAHHDGLRTRFTWDGVAWQQTIPATHDHDPLRWAQTSEQRFKVDNFLADQHASLNYETGDVFRACYFDGGDQPHQLAILVHHLVIDAVSWRILLEDLARVYGDLEAGMPAFLPPKTTPFTQWATQLHRQPPPDPTRWQMPAQTLPTDHPQQPNRMSNNQVLSFNLTPAETATLRTTAHTAYNTTISDLLLTALTCTTHEWTGDRCLLVALEGHGRDNPLAESVDITRTVGWFTTLYPVFLEMPASPTLSEIIIAIKEQLRQIQPHGHEYGLGHYMAGWQQPEIHPPVSLNYLGQFQGDTGNTLFKQGNLKTGSAFAPENQRIHQLEISAGIYGDSFRFQIQYSQAQYHTQTIQTLGDNFGKHLQKILAHCIQKQTQTYTPSDFSQVSLKQNELDDLLKQLSK
jgi:non-ribosomal peptide synthase protein (TIGR01720 family)